jgi:hypothetical protein
VKIYLYLVTGSGQCSVRDDKQIAYMHRKDWLAEVENRMGEDAPVDFTNLDDNQISEYVGEHTDDSALVVDLVGPDKGGEELPTYQEITLLIRPQGGLPGGNDVVGAYSSPADLPYPLFKDDEITWVSLQQ